MTDAHADAPLSSETLANSARVVTATVVNAVVSGASTVVVARALATAAFGEYSYWIFLMGLIASLSELGVNARGMNVVVRLWSGGDTGSTAAEMRRLLRFGLGRALVLGMATTIVFHAHPVAAVLIAAATMLRSLSTALSVFLVAQRRYRVLATSSVGVTVAQGIATSWVAIATHDAALTVGVFFAGQLIDVAVACAFAPWHLLFHRADERVSLPRLQPRTLLAFYVLGICQLVIFSRSETLVLHHANETIALGLFAIATTLAARATLLTDALYASLVPSLGAAANRDRDRAGRAYSTAVRFSSLVVLLTALVLGPAIVVLGPIILGASGGPVRVATAIVLGGSLLQTFVYPLTAIASVEMQRKAVALPAFFGAAFDLVAAIVLVPRYGLSGAAMASLLGALGFGLGLCAMVRLHGPTAQTLRAQLLRVAAMIAALIVSGVVTRGAAPVLAGAILWSTTIVVYAACGAGRGVLIRTDLDRLKGAAPRLAIRVPAATRGLLNRALLVAPRSSLTTES